MHFVEGIALLTGPQVTNVDLLHHIRVAISATDDLQMAFEEQVERKVD